MKRVRALAGTGPPIGDIGQKGDLYIDSTTLVIYRKVEASEWEAVSTPLGAAAEDAGGVAELTTQAEARARVAPYAKLIAVNGTGVLNFVDTFGSSMANWRTYYQAGHKKVSLFIPPGTYDLSGQTLVPGWPGAEVLAYGVSAKTGHFYMGVIPGSLGGGPMGRFETANAGASQITLINPAIYARYYPVGTWCNLMGFDLQFYGYPPNNQFNEFRQIIAIDTKTGLITLDKPLRNSYKSTWPLNLPGGWSSDDCGGPGSLFPMSGGWNSDFILRGMDIANNTGDLFGAVKNALFEDCSFNSIYPAPSATKTITFRRCKSSSHNGAMEVDKGVEKLEFDECNELGQIVIQSASVNELTVRDSDLPEILGNAQETLIQGSHIRHFKLGVAYGSARNLTIENSYIDYLETTNQSLWFYPSVFTRMSDGILTLPMGSIFTSNAAIQMCPGGSYYFGMRGVNGNIGGCFRVLDAWRDGGGTGPNWVYKTTLADPHKHSE